jgi:hypothetical protein
MPRMRDGVNWDELTRCFQWLRRSRRDESLLRLLKSAGQGGNKGVF